VVWWGLVGQDVVELHGMGEGADVQLSGLQGRSNSNSGEEN
jgi:hypothetical protein